MGRGLGVTLGLPVAVAEGVGVGGVTVAVAVGVGEIGGVAVAVPVGETVAVGLGVGVPVAVAVGVGHGLFTQPKISTVSTRQPSLDPVVSLAIRQRNFMGKANGRLTTVVTKPSELPLQACRPAIGLPRSVLIVRL